MENARTGGSDAEHGPTGQKLPFGEDCSNDQGCSDFECPNRVLANFLRAVGAREAEVLARALLSRFGSLAAVVSASWWSLHPIIGKRLAHVLCASHSMTEVMLLEGAKRGPLVPRSRDLVRFLQVHVGYLREERLLALYVDSEGCLLRIERIADGSIGHAPIDARKIMECGLAAGAAAFVLVHNHPSGNPRPSRDDIVATLRLRELGAQLDLHLLDHLIIARNMFCTVDECWRENQFAVQDANYDGFN